MVHTLNFAKPNILLNVENVLRVKQNLASRYWHFNTLFVIQYGCALFFTRKNEIVAAIFMVLKTRIKYRVYFIFMTRDCARELFQVSDKYSHIGCLQMIDVAGKLLNI